MIDSIYEEDERRRSFEGTSVDDLCDRIDKSNLKSLIKPGDLINTSSYRYHNCLMVNADRKLMSPEQVENYTIEQNITRLLEDPIDFYSKTDNSFCENAEYCSEHEHEQVVAYVDFSLEKVMGDIKTETKKKFDQFEVQEYYDNPDKYKDTIFSYGFYEGGLLVDGDNGWTPLNVAMKNGRTEAAMAMIDKGADMNYGDNVEKKI